MSATYCVVVPSIENEEGDLVPLEPAEAPNTDMAKRRARTVFMRELMKRPDPAGRSAHQADPAARPWSLTASAPQPISESRQRPGVQPMDFYESLHLHAGNA